MPGSVTSVFSEPGDFEAALREEGGLGLLITGRGQFRARLTQVRLHRLRMSAAEEQLSRIAFVAVPADLILVLLPIDGRPAPIWGGIGMRAGEIMTLGPGQRIHARTEGPSRSGSIWLPAQDGALGAASVSSGSTAQVVPTSDEERDGLFGGFQIEYLLDQAKINSNRTMPEQPHNTHSYDGPTRANAVFRYRVRRECGPIGDPALRRHCIASFSTHYR
jgi:hypothetical protein